MKKIYNCECVAHDEPTKLINRAENIKTGAKKEEIFTVNSEALRDFVVCFVPVPLEEYEYGLYREDVTLKEVVGDIIDQALEQF